MSLRFAFRSPYSASATRLSSRVRRSVMAPAVSGERGTGVALSDNGNADSTRPAQLQSSPWRRLRTALAEKSPPASPASPALPDLTPLPGKQTGAEVSKLVGLMQRLLAPDGCPWDREQTLATLVPYLVEETYEVVDALAAGDVDDHREELGDL